MSVIKHKEQRVGIFIDTQNLYHSARHLYNSRVNFGAVVKEVLGGRALVRALAYVVTTEAGDETQFFEALGKSGIEVKTKPLQIFAGGAKKADWDVGMAVDAITMAPKLDTIVLVTGDGDFVPLVEYLKYHEGCQVEVITFGQSASARLKEVAHDFIDMSEDPKKFLLNFRPARVASRGAMRGNQRNFRPGTNSRRPSEPDAGQLKSNKITPFE